MQSGSVCACWYKNGEKHGKTRYIWKDGESYQGPSVNGDFQGVGTYVFPDGTRHFVEMKKDSMPNEKMSYNYNLESWVWGYAYKFSNLTEEDSRFDDILELING